MHFKSDFVNNFDLYLFMYKIDRYCHLVNKLSNIMKNINTICTLIKYIITYFGTKLFYLPHLEILPQLKNSYSKLVREPSMYLPLHRYCFLREYKNDSENNFLKCVMFNLTVAASINKYHQKSLHKMKLCNSKLQVLL